MRTFRRAGSPAGTARFLATAILALQVGGVMSLTARGAELDEPGAVAEATEGRGPGSGAALISASSSARAPFELATPVAVTATSIATTTTTAPPAPPPPPPPPPAPVATPGSRLQAAYAAAVPAAWRSAIPVRFEIIGGSTSWATTDGWIKVGERHMATDTKLRSILAHEFGHLIAYRYGTQAYLGAPPAGWPAYSDRPEEAWADCASLAFTGINDPTHGLPACAGDSLAWARSWLGAGPP